MLINIDTQIERQSWERKPIGEYPKTLILFNVGKLTINLQGIFSMWKLYASLVLIFLLLCLEITHPASADPTGRVFHRGIKIEIVPDRGRANSPVQIVRGDEAFTKIKKAIDHLIDKSPISRIALKTLKKRGAVLIVYDPNLVNRSHPAVRAMNFLPIYYKNAPQKKGFAAIINRSGIAYEPKVISSLLATFLIGYGGQYLTGRYDPGERKGRRARISNEMVCESFLYSIIAQEDIGLTLNIDDQKTYFSTYHDRMKKPDIYCGEFLEYIRNTHLRHVISFHGDPHDDPAVLLSAFYDYRKKIYGSDGRPYKFDPLGRLRTEAENGDPIAQFNMGRYLARGLGVTRDIQASIGWYKKAALQGYVNAQKNLGNIYDDGTGKPRDLKEAARWTQMAAENGDGRAQYNMGRAFENGFGVTKNYSEAAKWYRLSAKNGFLLPKYRMGLFHFNGTGVKQDYAEALKWFKRAADEKYDKAQIAVGWMLIKGIGTERDEPQGVRWLERAAKQGLADAQFKLGWCHQQGIGTTKDIGDAVYWYSKAAKQKHGWAEFNLAQIYLKGELRNPDPVRALALFLSSAGHGVAAAEKHSNALSETLSPQEIKRANSLLDNGGLTP